MTDFTFSEFSLKCNKSCLEVSLDFVSDEFIYSLSFLDAHLCNVEELKSLIGKDNWYITESFSGDAVLFYGDKDSLYKPIVTCSSINFSIRKEVIFRKPKR